MFGAGTKDSPFSMTDLWVSVRVNDDKRLTINLSVPLIGLRVLESLNCLPNVLKSPLPFLVSNELNLVPLLSIRLGVPLYNSVCLKCNR